MNREKEGEDKLDERIGIVILILVILATEYKCL